MSEKNNINDFLIFGTPDDSAVTDDDFAQTSEELLFMSPIEEDEAEELDIPNRPFALLRKGKKEKAPRPKVRKFSEKKDNLEVEFDTFIAHEPEDIPAVLNEEKNAPETAEAPAASKEAPEVIKEVSEIVEKAPTAAEEAPTAFEKKEKKQKSKTEPKKSEKHEKEKKSEKLKNEKPSKDMKKKPGKKAEKVKPDKKTPEKSSVTFILALTLKLFLICTVVAALLAVVNEITAPIIEENQLAAKKAIIEEFFPEMTSYEIVESSTENVSTVYLIKLDDKAVGYCADVISTGFGGNMNMMVGVDTDCNVTGIKIISHSETPGFGTKVVENTEYLNRYTGHGKQEIVLGVDIDAISGVSTSSKAVNNGVNLGLSLYPDILGNVAEAVTPEPEIEEKYVTNELDALVGLYGWIQDLETPIVYEDSPFESLILLKAGGMDIGYVAYTSVNTEFESIKLLVGTYFGQVLGVRVLDYDGENFEKIAQNPDYFIDNYKNKTSFTYGTDIPVFEEASAEAEAIAHGVENVLRYYPTYLETAETLTEAEPNE